MNKTGFYHILIGIAALCMIGFVCVVKAEGQTASADPNQPAAENQSPPPKSDDPNAPTVNNTSDNSEQSDPSLTEEESGSRIPEFFDACDQLFSTYVTDKGMVQYAALRRSRADLLPTLRLLKEINPLHLMALDIEEKTAFWINVYNISILQLIIDNYPIQAKWYLIQYPDKSIMQISNPWTKNYFWVQGLQYNLKEIEQEFLLNRTRDPRICFALSSASLGGGRLRREAYRAEKLNQQLDDQVRNYLNSSFGYQLDQSSKTVFLSVFFQTKRSTFLASDYAAIRKFRNYPDLQRTWLNFIANYISKNDVEFLENNPCTFKMISFDWHLDEGS